MRSFLSPVWFFVCVHFKCCNWWCRQCSTDVSHRSRRFEAEPPPGHQQARSYRNWNPPLLGNLPDDFLRILPQQVDSVKVTFSVAAREPTRWPVTSPVFPLNRALRAVCPSLRRPPPPPPPFPQAVSGRPAPALGPELPAPPGARPWRREPQNRTKSWSSIWKTSASPSSCRTRSLWGSCSATASSSSP